MTNYLLVFLGGGLGSVCRFGIAQAMMHHKPAFPWATFVANVASCFVLGVLVGLSFKNKLGGQAALFLMAGFCGGFSTFSTFTNETFQLALAGEWGKAALNIGGSLLICGVSLFFGLKVVGRF